MPIEVAIPKYVQVVNAVQARIEDGTYPPGMMIPSETELMREFQASRPIVVRAFDLLRQDHWIEARQGKGRFVLGPPARSAGRDRGKAYALLNGGEGASVHVLSAGPVLTPARVASALGVDQGTAVIARQRLVVVDEVGPVELGTTYIPIQLAAGTQVSDRAPISEGVLQHLARVKGVIFDHVAERLSARLPTTEEAKLLDIGRREPVLGAVLTVCDRTAQPLLAVDLVLPGSRHELQDVFALN